MAQPILAWTANLYAGGFLSQGQSITATFHITQGWEAQIPIGVVFGSAVSLGPAVNVYPSSDGGTNFDTQPLVAFAIPTVVSTNQRQSIRLTTGQYAIQVQSSSPSTTVFIFTQMVITAIS